MKIVSGWNIFKGVVSDFVFAVLSGCFLSMLIVFFFNLISILKPFFFNKQKEVPWINIES